MPERIEATVRRVRFHNQESGFTVLTARRDDTREEITIVGAFPLFDVDESIVASGEWRDDRKFGRQFVAESVAPVVPTSRDGIRKYLAAGHVKGIGAKLAKRLLDHFGAELLQVIDRDPERLRDVPGLGKGTLKKIKESWNAQRGVRDLLVFLAQHGLGGARAFRIHKQYGDHAISLIRENPYRLAAEIRGIGFHTSDSIARGLGFAADSPERALAGLRHVADKAREHGDCGIAYERAVSEGMKLLGVAREIVEAAVVTAVRGGELVPEHPHGGMVLFLPPLHRAETRIANALLSRLDEPPEWPSLDVEKAMAIAEAEAGFALDPEQREAVRIALQSKVAVITGGPGVGKTAMVNVVLALFRSIGLEVALAAPTGRAAKRLGESTGAAAQTLHRLLETTGDGGAFKRNEDEPLEYDVVIVDETSMVDVPLFDALLRAMPVDAALLLVGDADQLPSIGPGQVLHDVIASGRVPAVRLTRIHRQAEESDIVVNAHRINRGQQPQFRGRGETTDMFLFPAATAEEALQHVVDLVSEKLPRKFNLKALRDVQVLSPMRSGTAGVHALNETLQRVLNPPARHRVKIERPNGVVFLPGDKVMQTENDYDKGVFNGDVGVLAEIDAVTETFTVDFGGESIVDYMFDEADQLTLAYATTIHKSQGSEYRAVILPLLPQHSIMLQRNLLYTAVTRGKEVVVIVGDRASIERAVRTSRSGERVTRLADLLRRP
ncbi:MAG TPA: ATP-dependent RecD-like DNA helicase [Thermoanaerobaculia bacterium]|nr:ATP-dependent RecD-like DNA helicase [Thermoanaerobaculia bacterium]